jgi:hypothetical protein
VSDWGQLLGNRAAAIASEEGFHMRSNDINNAGVRPTAASRDILIASIAGVTMASLTFSLLGAGWPSELPILGDPRPALSVLLFPGMIGAAALNGNAHAWHLWEAALVNGAIYYGLAWLGCRIVTASIRKARRIRSGSVP